MDINDRPLLVTVRSAQAICSVGRTTIYKLIAQKRIETVTVGRRRLIRFASLAALADGTGGSGESV